jgi:hypothetical protein
MRAGIQIRRNEIQARRNEIQGKRNEIKIAFLAADRALSKGLRALSVTQCRWETAFPFSPFTRLLGSAVGQEQIGNTNRARLSTNCRFAPTGQTSGASFETRHRRSFG